MSNTLISNAIKTIVNQLKTQLEGINGEGDYNLTVPIGNVQLGLSMVDQSTGLPIVFITRVVWEQIQEDQVSFMVLAVIEVRGFCKSEGTDNDLEYALMFCSDIERAIVSDETLGGPAYNTIINGDVYIDPDSGVGTIDIKLSVNFEVIKS